MHLRAKTNHCGSYLTAMQTAALVEVEAFGPSEGSFSLSFLGTALTVAPQDLLNPQLRDFRGLFRRDQ